MGRVDIPSMGERMATVEAGAEKVKERRERYLLLLSRNQNEP
jgi:hypothetical protein